MKIANKVRTRSRIWALVGAAGWITGSICGPALFAPEDVCCVTAVKGKNTVTTSALAMSAADCKVGEQADTGVVAGSKICSSESDPKNLCPELSAEARCKACGYYYDKELCLIEDPAKTKEKVQRGSEPQKTE